MFCFYKSEEPVCICWQKLGRFLGWWSVIYWTPVLWFAQKLAVKPEIALIHFFVFGALALIFVHDWLKSTPAG